MITKRRVTVTGGAGYIGSITSMRLLQQGFDVQIIDNLSTGNSFSLNKLCNAKICVGDIRDERFLSSCLEQFKPNAVLHFAAKAYVGESINAPLSYFENNVSGSISLLKVAIRTGIRNFVFSSTCAVYGNSSNFPVDESCSLAPLSPYGWSKLATEQLLRDLATCNQINSIALRYFNAAGASDDGELGEIHNPETHLIPLALRATSPLGVPLKVFGVDYQTRDGSCERDFLHVEDLALAHQIAVEKLCDFDTVGSFEALNLGCGQPHSVLSVIENVERVTNRFVKTEISHRREGDAVSIYADARNAGISLGWKPTRDLELMIRSAYDFEKAYGSL